MIPAHTTANSRNDCVETHQTLALMTGWSSPLRRSARRRSFAGVASWDSMTDLRKKFEQYCQNVDKTELKMTVFPLGEVISRSTAVDVLTFGGFIFTAATALAVIIANRRLLA